MGSTRVKPYGLHIGCQLYSHLVGRLAATLVATVRTVSGRTALLTAPYRIVCSLGPSLATAILASEYCRRRRRPYSRRPPCCRRLPPGLRPSPRRPPREPPALPLASPATLSSSKTSRTTRA